MSRALVCVDMEGIVGISAWPQCTPGDREWTATGRPLMAREAVLVASEVASFFDEVVVMDAHWMSNNLDAAAFAHLPNVTLLQGDLYDLTMVPDAGAYDALFQIGLHGKYGSPGAMSHNIIGAPLTLNGKRIGEVSLNGLTAADCGVPTLLVTGDASACDEAELRLGDGVRTVVTKLGRYDGGYDLRGAEAHAEIVQAIREVCAGPRPAPPDLGDGERVLALWHPQTRAVLFEARGATMAECYTGLLDQMRRSPEPDVESDPDAAVESTLTR